jgi:hypothetical protein
VGLAGLFRLHALVAFAADQVHVVLRQPLLLTGRLAGRRQTNGNSPNRYVSEGPRWWGL